MINNRKQARKTLSVFVVVLMLAGCSSGGGQGSVPSGPSQGDAPSGAVSDEGSPAARASGGQKVQYTFSTGSQGGVYNMVGVGMAKAINETVTDFEVIATVPTSVGQVPGMLEIGDIDLGIVMADVAERARTGTGEYEGTKVGSDMMDFGPALNNSLGFVTLASSGLRNIKDLEGKIFVMPSEGTRQQSEALLKLAGVDTAKVKWQQSSYQQSVDALLDGNVDAVALNASPYNSLVDQVAMKEYRWLHVDPEVVAAYDREHPYWKIREVPANTYPQQSDPIYTASFFGTVYISGSVPEEHAYQMIQAIMENNSIISSVYPPGEEVNLDSVRKYIDAGALAEERMHPGVIRYLKEVGVLG